jgi:hypothetical protein
LKDINPTVSSASMIVFEKISFAGGVCWALLRILDPVQKGMNRGYDATSVTIS